MRTLPKLQVAHSLAALFLGFLALAGSANAQETTVAVGRVEFDGTVSNSANTVNGFVSATHPATGQYFVSINTPGGFTGADPDDFVVLATVESDLSNGRTAAATVESVSNDLLVIEVNIGDVEDATLPGAAEERNSPFFFAIHRAPTGDAISADSHFLLATGRVIAFGPMAEGLATNGATLDVVSNATGDYDLVLEKPGAFADDDAGDYALLLTPLGSGSQDHVVCGAVDTVSSDDEVRFRIQTDDAQDLANDNATVAEDLSFFYSIYHIPPGGNTTRATSKFLRAIAHVDGNAGTLEAGATSYPGGSIGTIMNGPGDYHVLIEAPGRFAGVSGGDHCVQVTARRGLLGDEVVSGRAFVLNDDLLRIEVYVDDVETAASSEGTPVVGDFYVVLHEAIARPLTDIQVGKKASANSMKGNDIYNTSGSKQNLRVATRKPKAKFFFAVENDGNTHDCHRIRRKGGIKGVKARFFRLTGGKANITGAIRTSGYLTEDILPERRLRFFAKTRFRPSERPRGIIRLSSQSQLSGTSKDVCVARIVKKP